MVAMDVLVVNNNLLFFLPTTLTSSSSSSSWVAFQRHGHVRNWRQRQGRALFRLIKCFSSPSASPPTPSASEEEVEEEGVGIPESRVNLGLQLFSKGRVKEALAQFEKALSLDPNPVEAQAALYNKACCHAYRGEGKKAADCLRLALKEYNLKFSTILNDPDLASLRALPELKE